MQHKNTLGRIDTNADNLVHGRLPCLRSPTTSSWHIDAVGGRPPQQERIDAALAASPYVARARRWIPGLRCSVSRCTAPGTRMSQPLRIALEDLEAAALAVLVEERRGRARDLD